MIANEKFTDVLLRALIKSRPRALCWKIRRRTKEMSCSSEPNFTRLRWHSKLFLFKALWHHTECGKKK